MSNHKHTPGPWKITQLPLDGGVTIETENIHICTMADGDTDEDCLADARLIAAAPELLAALQDLELRATQARLASGIGRKKNHTDFLVGELQRLGDLARIVIGKAEGLGI